MQTVAQAVGRTPYPGRGIVMGMSADAKHVVLAYFIMGRSENSRNRVFVEEGEGLRTQAHDPSKLSDPSLIIYAPVRVLGRHTIVTNGDQTDTIYAFLQNGDSFGDALRTRAFEPDAPNFTPRISGVATLESGGFSYRMSLLKSDQGNGSACLRYFYEYETPLAGQGRFLHTYENNGDPLPSFMGEPEAVTLPGDLDAVTQAIWQNLNEENKVSLFVRFINLETGVFETRVVNKLA